MKYVFFILWTLLLFSCSSAKPSLSAKGKPSTLRAKTLRGIDRALTPMITASDLREAFHLTIAYADSLHHSPPVNEFAEVEPEDTLRQVLPMVIIVVISVAVVGSILLIYVAMQQKSNHP